MLRLCDRSGAARSIFWTWGALFVVLSTSGMSSEPDAEPASAAPRLPRLIGRIDAGLLALPNVGLKGGGGIAIPIEGTGAGLSDGYGYELGLEVRLSRWVALEGSAGRYSTDLEVGRSDGLENPVDFRSASIDLEMWAVTVLCTPPKVRDDRARLAVGALVTRTAFSDVPARLGIEIDERVDNWGLEVRGDIFLGQRRRWGLGGVLSFTDLGPSFTDLETGASGSLQASGMFLRLGVRGRW